ncbi:hypothetical protein [Nonomuraea sp. NPDC002799]
MEFWKTVFDLARHKFIGPPILAAAVLAGLVAFLIVPAHYTANVVLLLAGPGNTQPAAGEPVSAAGRTNPLLQDNAGLRTTAAALILATGTPEVLAELGAPKDGPSTLTIDDGGTNQALFGSGGPFLSITVDSPTERSARELVLRAQKRVKDDLAARQKELGAPQILYISLVNVTPPSTPEEQIGDKVQTAMIISVLMVFAGFSLAYAWQRRRARIRVAAAPTENARTEAVDTVAPAPESEPVPVVPQEPAAEEPEDATDTQTFRQVRPPVEVLADRDDDDEDAADTQTFPKVEIPSPRK